MEEIDNKIYNYFKKLKLLERFNKKSSINKTSSNKQSLLIFSHDTIFR